MQVNNFIVIPNDLKNKPLNYIHSEMKRLIPERHCGNENLFTIFFYESKYLSILRNLISLIGFVIKVYINLVYRWLNTDMSLELKPETIFSITFI